MNASDILNFTAVTPPPRNNWVQVYRADGGAYVVASQLARQLNGKWYRADGTQASDDAYAAWSLPAKRKIEKIDLSAVNSYFEDVLDDPQTGPVTVQIGEGVYTYEWDGDSNDPYLAFFVVNEDGDVTEADADISADCGEVCYAGCADFIEFCEDSTLPCPGERAPVAADDIDGQLSQELRRVRLTGRESKTTITVGGTRYAVEWDGDEISPFFDVYDDCGNQAGTVREYPLCRSAHTPRTGEDTKSFVEFCQRAGLPVPVPGESQAPTAAVTGDVDEQLRLELKRVRQAGNFGHTNINVGGQSYTVEWDRSDNLPFFDVMNSDGQRVGTLREYPLCTSAHAACDGRGTKSFVAFCRLTELPLPSAEVTTAVDDADDIVAAAWQLVQSGNREPTPFTKDGTTVRLCWDGDPAMPYVEVAEDESIGIIHFARDGKVAGLIAYRRTFSDSAVFTSAMLANVSKIQLISDQPALSTLCRSIIASGDQTPVDIIFDGTEARMAWDGDSITPWFRISAGDAAVTYALCDEVFLGALRDRNFAAASRTLAGRTADDTNGVPEGFTPWTGGSNPAGTANTETILRSGARGTRQANDWSWSHFAVPYDIVAYRVVPSTGFIPWAGGDRPISGSTQAEVMYRNGDKSGPNSAGDWSWAHSSGTGSDYDIVAYRVVFV